MDNLVDIVIYDTIDFDSVVFECWLDGVSPKKALAIKLNGNIARAGSSKGAAAGSSLSSPKRSSVSAHLFPHDLDVDITDNKGAWIKNAAALELLQCEIFDQYRTYDVLGHYIRSPQLLSEQTMLQLDAEAQAYVIRKYFELDDGVVREVFARKLAKNRKDIDEIADTAKCSLRRVTRYILC